MRAATSAMKVSPSLIYRNFKSGKLKRHICPLKPLLTDENKKARVQFCLSILEEDRLPHDPTFKNMYNMVHFDEKWFNMTRKNEKFYFLSDEEEPYQTCKSNNFVTKVIFFAGIARPRFDDEGNETFSEKIGIFPFVTRVSAKRSSVNRAAGIIETKAMTSVKRDTVRPVIINNVVPVILDKCPRDDVMATIVIRQDNAKTHIDPNDREFRETIQQSGFNIQIRCQPPNSPDLLNVLDLGFCRAIDSLKYQEAPRTTEEVLIVLEKAYETFSSKSSNNIFLTLQSCMKAIMEVRGGNNYKIPHMKKSVLERSGELPIQLKCDVQLYKDVIMDMIFEM
ncbi:uncharacterized protein LOC141713913 [Apium graveolens]|uniref:uncharacterized protein LOC141713913 n=1 Tax=Apium graveolens TaxID=4045 RepID=UPI003D7BFB64